MERIFVVRLDSEIVGNRGCVTFRTTSMAGKVGICVLGKGGNGVGINKVGEAVGSVDKKGGNGGFWTMLALLASIGKELPLVSAIGGWLP